MNKLGIILILLLSNFLFCAGFNHYTYVDHYPHHMAIKEIKVWIDAGFGEGDRVEIIKAIDQWNYALNGYIALDVQDDQFKMQDQIIRDAMSGGWLILKTNKNNSIVAAHDRVGAPALAFTDSIGGWRAYLVRDRDDNSDIKYLMLHEIGHLLGAKHLRDGLMSPVLDQSAYQCIDYDTMVEVSAYQNLPMADLNYCRYFD